MKFRAGGYYAITEEWGTFASNVFLTNFTVNVTG